MATLTATSSWALGLGRLSVQSALGETLKAEIEVASLSAEEAGSLKVRIAPPELYRSNGVEFNSVLSNTQVQLVRRADGRPYFRIQSDRAVQEPFVDVILEITWTGGRLVREYTLLFDPPATPSRQAASPAVATAPVMSPAPAETTPIPATPAPAPAPTVSAAPQRPAVPARAPAAPPPAAPVPQRDASQYQVKPGDTLSKVASKTQAPGISLDQMLVGLFRFNPDAFIEGNMNRLKSGSVLQVPSSEELNAVSQGEARQVIIAQSADFETYRQRLAGAAPVLKQDESPRQAKGQVQAAVEDRKPAAAPSPDKLTLSKAGVTGSEGKASKDTEKKDSAARVAELTRNVEELKKLSSAAKPAPVTQAAKPAAPPPSAPPLAAPPPSSPKAVAPPPSSPAAVAPPPSSPAAVAPPPSSPAAVAPPPSGPSLSGLPTPASKPKTVTAPAPGPNEPGLLDSLLGSPFVLPGAAAIIALLGFFGLRQLRARNAGKTSKPDTGFHESRLQPDSFFGSAGGQRVDTRDASTTGQSSMSYSLSQLDAIGDVDPVAEADVYLAYGRDLQAEEILKEALRANPERMAIRLKLLEVYAKRRDTKGFEQLAVHLYAETQGQGEDWAKAQELGRQIDPDNPLYQPGGAPAQLLSPGMGGRPEPMDASTLPQTVAAAGMATEPMMARQEDPGPASGLGDLDLDLDLGGDEPAPAMTSMEATQAMAISVEQSPMDMDFDLSKPPAAPAPAPAPADDLEFDLDQLDTAQPAAAEQGGSLDFDLSSIDLDLPAAPPPAAEPAADMSLPDLGGDEGDPLQRQLELADEFRQIGDTEGARDVLQELVAKATGPLKAKAQAMLDELR
ncbi:FimV/HubP family polar landmark protein [Pelomonas sp. SE-A7]|uniref:FimV/HubP family polar landmark protein n=1 Tax=Pelomonas sp. SE-A7 TaxID=3054953 RepID=UPI00259D2640|nr:FimV/HubP family polar landmark protein [Pelomonas sp. SE-A7]MDM4765005.1 FimV/HubP family polar landmark protein [Pelomonas sp. SE-A7]